MTFKDVLSMALEECAYKKKENKKHISQWHNVEQEPPRKPGYYQVLIESHVTYTVGGEIRPIKMIQTIDISGICFWNGEMWNKDISLDFTDGSRIAKTDKIYAWADVFIPLDDSACIHLYDDKKNI